LAKDWLKSHLLKAIQDKVRYHKSDNPLFLDFIRGIISIGYNTFPEASVQDLKSMKSRIPFLYHMVPSKSTFGPVICKDILNFTSSSCEMPSGNIEMIDYIPDICSYSIKISGPIPPSCLSNIEKDIYHLSQYEELEYLLDKIFNSRTLHEDDSQTIAMLKALFDKLEIPTDCRHSFSQFLQKKRELIFYNQVKLLLSSYKSDISSFSEGRDFSSISPLEHALFGALIDELDNFILKENWSKIGYEDIQKFLQLRIDLVVESLKLQILDFRNRFNNAKRNKQIIITYYSEREGPQFQTDEFTCSLNDLVAFGKESNLNMLVSRKHIMVLSNKAILNCPLIETLFESESHGLIHRSYLSRRERKENTIQIVVQLDNKRQKDELISRWIDISLRVKTQYEKYVVPSVHAVRTSLPSIFRMSNKIFSKYVSIATIFQEHKESIEQEFYISKSMHEHCIIADSSSLTIYEPSLEFDTITMEQLFDSILTIKLSQLLSKL
jgi:hypothetical protein